MNADEVFAELVARGFTTEAVAAEAGHPVTPAGRRARRVRWETSGDPDVRAAFEAGRLTGIDQYDQALIGELAFALGGPDAKSIRDGADRLDKAQVRMARRAAFDRSDPAVLAEQARNAADDRERQAERDRIALRAGLAGKPIGGSRPGNGAYYAGWREMRRTVTDEAWASIWSSGLTDHTRQQLGDLKPADAMASGRSAHPALRVAA